MRPLKLIAVVFSGLLVTVCLIYTGILSVPSSGSQQTSAGVINSYETINARPDTITQRMRNRDPTQLRDSITSISIHHALNTLLTKQAQLNTRDSLSRHDFNTVVTLSLLLPHIKNISRIPTPSPETFRSYIAPGGLPIIFTDMLVGTTMDNWSWDLVKTKWGNIMFPNTRQGNYSSRVNKFGKHKINRVTVRLADFIDIVTGRRSANENENGLYITKQKMLPTEELEREFVYPPFYNSKQHKKCFLEPTGWIGASGTYTQGHIDSKDNFVYQLIGSKRWTIFPPYDYHYLYYKQGGKGSLEWSSALSQPGPPDPSKYPLYANAHPITFVMNPGEVLYLPRGWTHFVENVTPALMINTWRRGPAAITEEWIEKNKAEIRRLCY